MFVAQEGVCERRILGLCSNVDSYYSWLSPHIFGHVPVVVVKFLVAPSSVIHRRFSYVDDAQLHEKRARECAPRWRDTKFRTSR